MIKIPKKIEYVRFKNHKTKIKPPFMVYVYFESILVSEDNGKQNPDKSYKYLKNVAYSCDYKLECIDDTVSKLLSHT